MDADRVGRLLPLVTFKVHICSMDIEGRWIFLNNSWLIVRVLSLTLDVEEAG